MSDENTSKPESEDEQLTTTYRVAGWAEVAPSGEIELQDGEAPDDVPREDLEEVLREDLRERGFTDDQIEQMHIQVEHVEPNY